MGDRLATFKDFYDKTQIELTITGTNLSRRKTE